MKETLYCLHLFFFLNRSSSPLFLLARPFSFPALITSPSLLAGPNGEINMLDCTFVYYRLYATWFAVHRVLRPPFSQCWTEQGHVYRPTPFSNVAREPLLVKNESPLPSSPLLSYQIQPSQLTYSARGAWSRAGTALCLFVVTVRPARRNEKKKNRKLKQACATRRYSHLIHSFSMGK